MPGLDVLRGLAIAMVLVYHGIAARDALFTSATSAPMRYLHMALYQSYMGVHLFFILSGFLITGILLDSRSEPDYYRNFYLRRALRIVPAYLVMLAVLLFTDSITLRYLLVCLLYFCNMSGIFGVGPQYGPLWSLSVEEQFYLVWPFVVRKLSIRRLAILCLALIALTPALRFALLLGPPALRDIHYKTWALLDFFAAGALLAIAIRSSSHRPSLPRAVVPLSLAGVLLYTLVALLPFPQSVLLRDLLDSIQYLPWLLTFTGLVLAAYLYPSAAKWPIVKPMIFLARISYGLYLYHLFLFDLIGRHWPANFPGSLGPAGQSLLQFAAQVAAAIVVAYISRNTLEQFFLRLKPKHQPASTSAAGRPGKE